MPYKGPASNKAMEDFLARNEAERHECGINKTADLVRQSGKLPQHYWVSLWGLSFNVATIPLCPCKKASRRKRYKYLGFTFDNSFPKKLNTGRVLYEDTKKLPKVSKN